MGRSFGSVCRTLGGITMPGALQIAMDLRGLAPVSGRVPVFDFFRALCYKKIPAALRRGIRILIFRSCTGDTPPMDYFQLSCSFS